MAPRPPARPRPRPRRGEHARAARLQAILDAALDEFSERGFAAARLEDVAARAGVAKGTLYLYLPSKEALFEALVRSAIAEPVRQIEARLLAGDAAAADPEAALRALYAWVRQEVLGTRRREIARLVLTEGPRFPAIAEFYHHEVVARALGLVRRIAARAVATGAFRSDELVRFPHLAAAPVVLALLWRSLFERLEPLDLEGLFDAQVAVLMRALRREGPP